MTATARPRIYIVPIDRWYIERTVWLVAGVVLLASTGLAWRAGPLWIVGVTATGAASIAVALTSPWWLLFSGFVGVAMVWFAATGFCIMANALYWRGAEPRLVPSAARAAHCEPAAAAAQGS